MSATNSRIAFLKRSQRELLAEYWDRKANHTVREAANFSKLMKDFDHQIELEKLRTVDYLKAS